MTETYTVTDAGAHFGELVNRARRLHEPVPVTEHGQTVAAIISADELAELQAVAVAADIAAVRAIEAEGRPQIPGEQVNALFDALDAADEAATPEEKAAILAPHAELLARLEAAETAQ